VRKAKKHTLAEQYSALRLSYPLFSVKLGRQSVSATGQIQPTPRSLPYTFKLKYRLAQRPKVNILEPQLEKHENGDPIPHVYPGNELCLYYPKYQEFNSSMLIADCIIPWTSLWLYHYENWHITGDWEGGGVHPQTNIDAKKK